MLFPVLILAMFITSVSYLWSIFTNPDKALDLAIGLDRVTNRAFNGTLTETLSSRANRVRSEKRAWGCILCGFLDWISKGHCKNSAGI
jgi:hypothetical protein